MVEKRFISYEAEEGLSNNRKLDKQPPIRQRDCLFKLGNHRRKRPRFKRRARHLLNRRQ